MAEMALHDHVPHYHASVALKGNDDDLQFLDNYKGKKGFFIKKFLINDKFNLNDWRVTWEGMKKDIWGFIGKPLVLTPEKDHPEVYEQEDYRVGNIIDVGLDEINHIAWQVSEVFDKHAQEKILAGEVEFGSPTVLIYSEDTREIIPTGLGHAKHVLHRFKPAHDALVGNPAYNKEINNIAAVCTGDPKGCALKLLTVSASLEYRDRYEAKAKRLEKPESYFDSPQIKEQLAIGIKVEMEHTDDGNIARNIAMDHLAEYPDYYTRLATIFPDVPKSAEVNSDNVQQLTIVPFVQHVLKSRFRAEQLAMIVGNIRDSEIAASDSCVSRKIKILADEHPSWEHDKIIAVAYSYCEGSKASEEMEAMMLKSLTNNLMRYSKK